MPENDCRNSVCLSCCRKADNELADVTLSGRLLISNIKCMWNGQSWLSITHTPQLRTASAQRHEHLPCSRQPSPSQDWTCYARRHLVTWRRCRPSSLPASSTSNQRHLCKQKDDVPQCCGNFSQISFLTSLALASDSSIKHLNQRSVDKLRKLEDSRWFSLEWVSARSSLKCCETVCWVAGRASYQ